MVMDQKTVCDVMFANRFVYSLIIAILAIIFIAHLLLYSFFNVFIVYNAQYWDGKRLRRKETGACEKLFY